MRANGSCKMERTGNGEGPHCGRGVHQPPLCGARSSHFLLIVRVLCDLSTVHLRMVEGTVWEASFDERVADDEEIWKSHNDNDDEQRLTVSPVRKHRHQVAQKGGK